jgi:DtxR family Mn-dependent transcriptional regulator
MKKTQGTDEYLEAIYVLSTEGQTVLGSVLAQYLDVSRPTVTQMIQKLNQEGYVNQTESREIVLTEEGKQRAEVIVRRHRLIERWLTDVLGFDWATAHEEASRLEYAISERVEKRLAEVLGYPTTCPHGNVIPGSGKVNAMADPISSFPIPSKAKVIRIFEHAEEDPDTLHFLEGNGIVPGAEIELVGVSKLQKELSIIVDKQNIQVPLEIADRILALEV